MLFQNKAVDRFQLISVPVTAFSRKFVFPDLPELRNVITTGIHYYPDKLSKTDNLGVDCWPAIDTLSAFVTFMQGNKEFISNLDLSTLVPFEANGVYGNRAGTLALNNVEIDYSQSYVSLSENVAAIAAYPKVFMFGIFYSKK